MKCDTGFLFMAAGFMGVWAAGIYVLYRTLRPWPSISLAGRMWILFAAFAVVLTIGGVATVFGHLLGLFC